MSLNIDSNETTESVNLLSLANGVLRQTQSIVGYLQANNYAQPTFAPDCVNRPETFDYAKLHSGLKRSLEDLQYLIKGPKRHFRAVYCQGYELAAIQVALDFNFFAIVAAEGQIPLQELAHRRGST